MPDASIAAHTVDLPAGPARLLVLPTPIADVVSFRASFGTGPDLSSDDDIRQGLLVDLLDKGTRRRDRFAVAEELEGMGAELTFESDGLRVGFTGKALRADLDAVLAIAAEQLLEPALAPDEVAKAVTNAVASVRRSLDSTSTRASGALRRRLYPEPHPNYTLRPEVELAALDALDADALRAYHERHVGPRDFTIAVVGDADPEATRRAVAGAFGAWDTAPPEPVFAREAAPQPPGRETVELPDRPNLDVRLGHAVALRRDAHDFLAAYAAVFALGGNFSGHLMQTIRDEQGLTYGINASLSDVAVEHDCHMRVSVTLSAPDLERGIEATRTEVARFVEQGVSAEALERTRTALAGRHVVALATTSGFATRLLINAERGFSMAYIDRYPERVAALELDAVNAALRRYVRPDDLHVVAAGTPA